MAWPRSSPLRSPFFLATSGDSESTTEGATVEFIDDETDGDGNAADTTAGDTTASADSEEPAAAADSTNDDGTADGEGVSEWSNDDPTGDWQQWDTFDTIDRTRERNGVSAADFQDAADLVGVSVSATADATEVAVSHFGDAQAVQAADEGDFSQAIIIVLSDGTRLEVLFRDDGSVKIVSPPPGVSVTSEWITPQQVLFTLSGITIDVGSTIEATLYLEIFGGVMLDVVDIVTS